MADLDQMFSALQKADAAGNVDDAREIAKMIREYQAHPAEPETSGFAAAAHSMMRETIPTAAGFVGAGAGSVLGAPAGPVGALGLGLTGAIGAASAASAAQEKVLEHYPAVARFLGLDPETQAKEAKEHPEIAEIAGYVPSLIGLRPSTALFKSTKGLSENAAKALRAEKAAAAVNATLGAGIGAGTELGFQAVGEEPMDYRKVGTSALLGLLGQKETAVGRKLSGIGESVGTATQRAAVNALRRPTPAEAPVVPPTPPKPEEVIQEFTPHSESLYKDEMLREMEPGYEPPEVKPEPPPEPPPVVQREETPIQREEEIAVTPVNPPVGEHKTTLPVLEIPVKNLKLSTDVPQFKKNANEKGVVEPLQGEFDRRGMGPLQVWERLNGDQEVISGRHRFDLAQRTEQETVPVQIYKESEGFDARQAAMLDAELNIRDNQGKVPDYVQYFRGTNYTPAEAESRGLLARAAGRRGYAIATNGSEDLIASHSAGKLSDEAADRIANTAPQDPALQALGMKQLQNGKNITDAVNFIHAVKTEGGPVAENGDLFGYDDSAIKKFEEMADIAKSKQNELSSRISAISGAAKNPKVAKAEGIDVKDPDAILKRIDELKQQRAAWENWSTNPELTSEVRRAAGLEVAPEPVEAPPVDTDTQQMFSKETTDLSQLQDAQASKIRGGKVEHREGDIALYSSYNNYGGPHYHVSKGTKFYDHINPAGLTSLERARVEDIKNKIESEAEKKHAQSPFIKFTNGLAASDSVPKGIANITRGWKNLLGVKANLYLTTFEDVQANKDKFTGPHREVNAALDPQKSSGLAKKMENGDYYIAFKPKTSKTAMLETLAHELGHIHEKEVYANAAPETKKALNDAFNKWFAENKPKLSREYVEALRSYETGKRTKVPNPNEPAARIPNFQSYWGSFAEWYADNMAKWATSNEKPLTIVDKFFAKLGNALRKFYNGLKGAKYLPDETFAEYINKSVANLQFDEIAKQQQKGQMALFSKEAVENLSKLELETLNVGKERQDLYDKFSPKLKNLLDKYSEAYKNAFYVDQGRWAGKEGQSLKIKEGRASRAYENAFKDEFPNEKISPESIRMFVTRQGRFESFDKLLFKSKEGIQLSKESTEEAPPVSKHRNVEGQVVSPVWNSPEVSKIDDMLYKLQDKHIDTKRVISEIEKAAGKLDDKWNVYLQEELYHGRTSSSIRDFLLKDLLPTVKEMKRLGISPEDMKEYLHFKHAGERNDQIARIRPEFLEDGTPNPDAMLDKGSGKSYAEIKDYFNKLDPEKEKKLNEVAQKFREMIKRTQDILVKSGAETQKTINTWNKTYKDYVPLFREDDDFATHPSQGTGAGFSSQGSASKRATGSEKEVQDILSNIIAQRERALIKAEKMRVGRALYGAAIKNPNPSFWLPVSPRAIKNPELLASELQALGLDGKDIVGMMEEKRKPEVYKDPKTGLETVKYKVNPLERYKDNVFPVRVNGQDSYIFFNAKDPRAKRMVEAMKNLDTNQLGEAMGMVGKLTRWFAAVNTQYNPVFGGINLLRDVGGAQFNLTTTPLAGMQGKVNAQIFPSMRTIWKSLRAERMGQALPDEGDFAKWNEFRREGGQTLYRDSLVRKAEEKQIVEHELEKLGSHPFRKAFMGAADLLSDFNDSIENAIRFSAYKVATEKGLSNQQAASIAKNLTVNFDRKGQLSSQINSLYAFFNASAQGTARLAQTLTGPAGRKIMAGGIILGSAQAMALAAAGFEEDEPPDFIKERNLIIPLPDHKYAMIPMPLGLHLFPNIGRETTEWALSGFKHSGKHTTNIMGTTLDAFNPLGGSSLGVQTLTPTLLDPLVALEANKDAFGRPIYRADRATNPTPGYLRSREGASAVSKNLAEFLNYASGGTEFKKGAISPTGDSLDYLAGQFTGGAGREVMKAEQAVESAVTGEELPPYRVPIAGRFIGDTESKAADSQRFYDNVTRLSEHENEIKGRQKSRGDVAGYLQENPEARLWQRANNVENQISALNKRKKEFQERGMPRERIQAIDEQKQEIMRRFNEQVKAAQE